MGTNLKITIALVIAVFAALASLWQLANIRGQRARGRRRSPAASDRASSQRRGDKRVLGGHDKRMYKEADKLRKAGKIAPAARILEQIGLFREAVQALEDAGLIHDAAKTLMRMQRHNRAGVIYARHGMWDHAAACFKQADMPLEVAKCLREAGDLKTAAEYFALVGRHADAADCFGEAGEFLAAARQFINAGQVPQGMQMLHRLVARGENPQAIDLTDSEIQMIITYLSEGHGEKGLVDIAMSRNKLAEVILNLANKAMVPLASQLYTQAKSDIGPMLMADVNYQDQSATALSEIFLNVGNYQYAGRVLERLNSFDQAAAAFLKADDLERAIFCYERAGMDAEAKAARERLRGGGPAKSTAPVGQRRDFALANLDHTGAMPTPPGNEALSSKVQMLPKAMSAGPTTNGIKVMPAPPAMTRLPGIRNEVAPTEQANEGGSVSAPPAPPPRMTPSPRNAPKAVGAFSLADDEDRSTSPAPAPPSATATAAASRPPPPNTSQPSAGKESDVQPALAPPSLDKSGELYPGQDPGQLDEVRAAFHRAKFFVDLDFTQRNTLWNIGETLHYRANQTILTYDDEPRGIYIIVHGSVSCYRDVNGSESYIDQMGAGESFGELWLLADQPTSVRFVAVRDSQLRIIDREAFNELLDKDGAIARKIYKRFTMRLLRRLLKPLNPQRNSAAS